MSWWMLFFHGMDQCPPSCPDVPVLSWCHLSLAPVPVTTVNWMNSVSSGGNSVLSVSVQRWLVYLFTRWLVHSLTRSLVDPSAPAHCMSVWWPDLWPFRSVVSFLQMRGTGSRRRPSPSGSTSISSRWVSLGLYSLDMWWPLTFEMGAVL